MIRQVLLRLTVAGSLVALPSFVFSDALANQGEGASVGTVASNITQSLVGVSGLLTAICYIVGMGFALSGMMKMKAHRDSPQQMPLSHPLTDLAIAFSLIFLPILSHVAGSTAFDDAAKHATPEGSAEYSNETNPVYVEKRPRKAPPPPPGEVGPYQKERSSPYLNR